MIRTTNSCWTLGPIAILRGARVLPNATKWDTISTEDGTLCLRFATNRSNNDRLVDPEAMLKRSSGGRMDNKSQSTAVAVCGDGDEITHVWRKITVRPTLTLSCKCGVDLWTVSKRQ